MPAQILIGTPSHADSVNVNYLRSIFGLMKMADPKVVEFDLLTISHSSIENSRNLFASKVLSEPALTHLLFIDSDNGFEPELVLEMLRFDRPLVGAMCPTRHISLIDVQKAAQRESEDAIHYISNRYVNPQLIPEEGGRFLVRDGFVRARSVGAGIMLIKREVLERMADLPGLLVQDYASPSPLFGSTYLNCFGHLRDHRGLTIGEDLSFCKRWTDQCNGEIWCNIVRETTHTGYFNFKGKFIEYFKAHAAKRST